MKKFSKSSPWQLIKEGLEKLTEAELEILIDKSGIQIPKGINNIKSKPGLSRKEQFILLLDEGDRDIILNELNKK